MNKMPRSLAQVFFALLAPLAAVQAQSVYTTPYTITTFAGTPGMIGSTDGTGAAARFSGPQSVAVDSSGNVYVADTVNSTIRKITPAGVVTTFAGTAGSSGYLDATGSAARFAQPVAVAVDAAGNLYVAEWFNATIRKITPAAVVTTLAGSATQTGYVDATGGAARFSDPFGIAVDGTGNVYVAESGYHTIRKITPGGVVTTFAGTVSVHGSADGTGTAATFYAPNGVATDSAGNVYVADTSNQTIRKITTAGVVTTIAGSAPSSGSTDGTGSAARFSLPAAVAVDGSNNVYVAEYTNNTIRRVTSGGVVTTLAGTPGTSGFTDGTGAAARFRNPLSIAVDAAQSIYVLDSFFTIIRKGVGTSGRVSGDVNGDGKTDAVFTNTSTGERAIWLLNGASVSSGASLGVLATNWAFSGLGDFNGDGKADIFLTNTTTAERGIWFMNGTAIASASTLGVVANNWVISVVGDFDGNGKSDIFLTNTSTGERGIWLMNGAAISTAASVGFLPTDWSVSGTGDFNGDGNSDILLTNTVTSERAIWLVYGDHIGGGASLGLLSTNWAFSGVGDLNADGKADIFLTNTSTGERGIWLVNGLSISSSATLGVLSTNWFVSRMGDYNGDGRADIFLTNTSTGERGIWLMNGTTVATAASLGVLPTNWSVTR